MLLLPYLAASVFAHPAADDFIYAARGRDYSFLKCWIDDYFFWNGRYTSNWFMYANPIAYNLLWLYRLVPVLLISILLLSLNYFFRSIYRFKWTKAQVFLASLVTAHTILSVMPNLAEGIYWYTGAVTYTLSFSLALLYFGLLLRLIQNNRNSTLQVILASVLLILTIGFNETIMIIVLLFNTIIVLSQKENRRLSILFLILTFICIGIVYFAPGNQVRASFFPEKYNLLRSGLYSVAQTGRFGFLWFFSGSIIAGSFLLAPYGLLAPQPKIPGKSPLWLIVTITLVLFLSVFPAYFYTNILGQHRTVNLACMVTVLIWFAFLPNTIRWIQTMLPVERLGIKRMRIAVLIAFLVCITASGNGLVIYRDFFSGKITAFDREMKLRHSILSPTQNNQPTLIESISNQPKSLFVLDLSTDSAYFNNKGHQMFYKLPYGVAVSK